MVAPNVEFSVEVLDGGGLADDALQLLDPTRPYKPLDVGEAGVSASVDAYGRLVAVSQGRPAHGAVTLMATIVAALVVLALAVPASARPAGPDSAATAAVAASVPNCVDTYLDDSGYWDYLLVINLCDHSVRVKVVLAFHTDKSCRTIAANNYYDYTWRYPGRFDGLVSC